MFGNIKKNNVRSLNLRLWNDEYYDFMLYRGETYGGAESTSCLVAGFDPDRIGKDGEWKSHYVWGEAVNSGLELRNIGYTGIDNGTILFDKSRITNADFLKIFTGSTLEIEGKEMVLRPVSGNTMRYDYPYEVNDGYVALKGGFFQGFYKVEGSDYKVLPNVIDTDWNFEFVLRRRDYEVGETTLNHRFPENNGIFFYMGTRAENKFAVYYGVDEKEYVDGAGEGGCGSYFAEDAPVYENACGNRYLCDDGNLNDILIDRPFADEYFSDDSIAYEDDVCGEDDYFKGDYFDKGCPENGLAVGDEYFETDVELDDETLKNITTDDGFSLSEQEYASLTTDNKHVFFNRTKTGYTASNWDESISEVRFIDVKKPETENKFLLFNRTETGLTTENYDEYEEQLKTEQGGDSYDVLNDIKENAFALVINEDGSIGYRYGVTDCDSESGYSVKTERSLPGLVPMDKWVTINVRVFLLDSMGLGECGSRVGKRTMKIYIYVDGNLVFISQDLPEFRFRALADVASKQEGVPFNISVGGGTQGLADGIWFNDLIVSPDYFPLMRDFGGSFMGDLKSFRFFDCFRESAAIRASVLE